MTIILCILNIANNTTFKDYDTKEVINLEELKNKLFIIYSLIYSPTLNIYDGKTFINFTLKTAIIKIIEQEVAENIEISDNDAINAFNKYIS